MFSPHTRQRSFLIEVENVSVGLGRRTTELGKMKVTVTFLNGKFNDIRAKGIGSYPKLIAPANAGVEENYVGGRPKILGASIKAEARNKTQLRIGRVTKVKELHAARPAA